MKNLILLSLCISLCLFVSCSEDEADNGIPSELLGLWTLITQIDSDCDDPSENITEDFECTDDSCLTVEFREDGTGQTEAIEPGFGTLIDEFTYTVSGSTLTLQVNDSGDIFTFENSFNISGNTLTIVEGPEEFDTCTSTSIFTKN